MALEERVLCENPDPGKQGTRIPKWKYDAVRTAILASVTEADGGLPFKELARQVRERLPKAVLDKLGSATWFVTVVKLDLEAKGTLERVPGSKPQRLRRT